MKKLAMFFCVIICVVPVASFSEELNWERISSAGTDLRAVAVNSLEPRVICVVTNRGVLRSSDKGESWKIALPLKPARAGKDFLTYGISNKKHLYAFSRDELFFSPDTGVSWKKLFRLKASQEASPTAILIMPGRIYLGTSAGLFVSEDNGRIWQRQAGVLAKQSIIAITGNVNKPQNIYVASLKGAFSSQDAGASWKMIQAAQAPVTEDNDDQEIDYQNEELRDCLLNDLLIDPRDGDILYLASAKGISQSKDNGLSWQALPEYGLLSQDVRRLFFSPRGELYALTNSGIFVLQKDRWRELSFGLDALQVRFLSWQEADTLYAACDTGLFCASFTVSSGNNMRAEPLCVNSTNEPSIRQVQEAAIEYAEVNAQKIASWRRKAALKAYLPRMTAGVNRDTVDLWHWEGGSTTKSGDDALIRGRDSIEWDLSLSWDFSQLIWSDDQTNIDVRSRLMVELRDDILDQVTKLYFERERIKLELDELGFDQAKKRLEKQLRLDELSALLDGFTNGYFSAALK